MCGIFGILSTKQELEREKFAVPNQTLVLKHRGPDDFGYFLDSNVYFGHRRLSIIDLESGKQPIFNEDRTICVIFNGEIYNFQEIRKELEVKGHRFDTNTDTEVIIHSYEEFGERCVEKFRGMFAFAIWDRRSRELFLARDRLGIKPLFYADWRGVFYFASEMKAILQFQEFPREIDFEGLGSYFTLSYIPAPLTIFKHIKKLLPGHILKIRDGRIEIKKYWDLYFQPDRSKRVDYFKDGFKSLFDEAVKLELISDVPLGAFLSGGVDSGAIVYAMSRNSLNPVRTFCIGFGGDIGGYLDERAYARQVASRYKTTHTEHEVSPDFHNIVEEIVKSFDEPFADASAIPSYYVCKASRPYVTVALSGLGGDELFGGYERYLGFRLSHSYNRLPSFLREKVIRQIVEKIPERENGHYTVNHLKRFVRSASLQEDSRYTGFLAIGEEEAIKNLFSEPQKYKDGLIFCKDLLLNHFNSPNASESMDRVFYCDVKTYLPEDILACTDRMSMQHSLEVRVPFLDHKLMEFCATIPSEMKVTVWGKKHILKKALAEVLPKGVLKHRKQGFIGPMSRWLQRELRPYVLEILKEQNLDRHGIFNKKTVKKVLNQHFNRVEMNDKLIWSLVMFQSWYHFYIEDHFPVTS